MPVGAEDIIRALRTRSWQMRSHRGRRLLGGGDLAARGPAVARLVSIGDDGGGGGGGMIDDSDGDDGEEEVMKRVIIITLGR